jgi:hypothetical protein
MTPLLQWSNLLQKWSEKWSEKWSKMAEMLKTTTDGQNGRKIFENGRKMNGDYTVSIGLLVMRSELVVLPRDGFQYALQCRVLGVRRNGVKLIIGPSVSGASTWG